MGLNWLSGNWLQDIPPFLFFVGFVCCAVALFLVLPVAPKVRIR